MPLYLDGTRAHEDRNFGHAACVRKHPTTREWYLLDSIKGKPLKLRESDWALLKGSAFVLAMGSAYSRNCIMGAREEGYTQLTDETELLLPLEVNITHCSNARPRPTKRQNRGEPTIIELLDRQGDTPEQTNKALEAQQDQHQPQWEQRGKRLFKKRSIDPCQAGMHNEIHNHESKWTHAQNAKDTCQSTAAAQHATNDPRQKTCQEPRSHEAHAEAGSTLNGDAANTTIVEGVQMTQIREEDIDGKDSSLDIPGSKHAQSALHNTKTKIQKAPVSKRRRSQAVSQRKKPQTAASAKVLHSWLRTAIDDGGTKAKSVHKESATAQQNRGNTGTCAYWLLNTVGNNNKVKDSQKDFDKPLPNQHDNMIKSRCGNDPKPIGNARKQAQETDPPQTNDRDIRKTHFVSVDAHELQPKDTTNPNLHDKSKPPLDRCRHDHRPGSIQACSAAESRKQTAAKQQSPELPTKENADADEGTHLQQAETDLDCHISLDNRGRTLEIRQASTTSKTCKANANSHTDKQTPHTEEKKKKKAAGAYTPRCDNLTILKWNVMGSTTVQDELKQIAQKEKPWIIVLTETKLTDARQDRVFLQDYLPEYALHHSCVKGNDSGQCRTGSGGVAIAVHKSLTSQHSVELIDHNHPATKSHLKTLKIRPPGSDCLTIYGVYLPSDDVQKREVLYQAIQDAMRSEREEASHAGLSQPYNIMAGDMNAAVFKEDVQRTKPNIKDTKHQKFIKDMRLHTTDPEKHFPSQNRQ